MSNDIKITLDEFLAAVAAAQQDTGNDGTFSIRELEMATGKSTPTARDLVRAQLAAGRLKLRAGKTLGINGRYTTTTRYEVVHAPAADQTVGKS